MERFIQLNLRNDGEKTETPSLPSAERKDHVVIGKRVNRFMKKAAHKAAGEFSRNKTSGIFTK